MSKKLVGFFLTRTLGLKVLARSSHSVDRGFETHCCHHSKILGQYMNLANAPQCCPSRGQQHVAPQVDLSLMYITFAWGQK